MAAEATLKAQVTIGPWIEHVIYRKILMAHRAIYRKRSSKLVQKEMVKIINRKPPVIREEAGSQETPD